MIMSIKRGEGEEHRNDDETDHTRHHRKEQRRQDRGDCADSGLCLLLVHLAEGCQGLREAAFARWRSSIAGGDGFRG